MLGGPIFAIFLLAFFNPWAESIGVWVGYALGKEKNEEGSYAALTNTLQVTLRRFGVISDPTSTLHHRNIQKNFTQK